MSQPLKTDFFKPELLGGSLKPVAEDLIHLRDQRVTSSWLHSDHGADLILWWDERGNLIKQHVSFWGQVVQWDIVHGLKTGLVIEKESDSPQEIYLGGKDSPVHFDSSVQKTTLAQALEILSFVKELDGEELAQVVRNFLEAPTLKDFKDSELLRRFAPERGLKRAFKRWWRSWHLKLKLLFSWFPRR